MKYIGNHPGIEITQLQQGAFDYVYPSNPTIDVNPSTVPVVWLNITTGEEFICINNMPGANIWKGQLGTTVPTP